MPIWSGPGSTCGRSAAKAVETFRLQTPEEVVLDVEKGTALLHRLPNTGKGLMQILANFIRNALKFTPKGIRHGGILNANGTG